MHHPRALKARSVAGESTGHHDVAGQHRIEPAHQLAAVDMQAVREQQHAPQGGIVELASDRRARFERFGLRLHAGRGGRHAGAGSNWVTATDRESSVSAVPKISPAVEQPTICELLKAVTSSRRGSLNWSGSAAPKTITSVFAESRAGNGYSDQPAGAA